MKIFLIEKLVAVLVGLMDEALLKRFADWVLDFAEDAVIGSKSTIDDAIVLPLCETIRSVFNIPDNDEVKPED